MNSLSRKIFNKFDCNIKLWNKIKKQLNVYCINIKYYLEVAVVHRAIRIHHASGDWNSHKEAAKGIAFWPTSHFISTGYRAVCRPKCATVCVLGCLCVWHTPPWAPRGNFACTWHRHLKNGQSNGIWKMGHAEEFGKTPENCETPRHEKTAKFENRRRHERRRICAIGVGRSEFLGAWQHASEVADT